MDDNIIYFPNPDEYDEDGEKGEVMARISVYENGPVGCWVSDEIDNAESKTWLKACISDGVYGIHSVIHQNDEGSGPIVEKDYDELD